MSKLKMPHNKRRSYAVIGTGAIGGYIATQLMDVGC